MSGMISPVILTAPTFEMREAFDPDVDFIPVGEVGSDEFDLWLASRCCDCPSGYVFCVFCSANASTRQT